MFAMMHVPLTVGSMLEHAENFFPKKEVISQTHDKLHRLTYKEIGQRTRRLMSVLEELGAQKGDRIGTLAWNHHRHLELYFAAPGMGSVLHTINIRLRSEEHTSELQSRGHLVCRLLLEKKKINT